jgi:hypothetical protein
VHTSSMLVSVTRSLLKLVDLALRFFFLARCISILYDPRNSKYFETNRRLLRLFILNLVRTVVSYLKALNRATTTRRNFSKKNYYKP